jgi:hypothetical protein
MSASEWFDCSATIIVTSSFDAKDGAEVEIPKDGLAEGKTTTVQPIAPGKELACESHGEHSEAPAAAAYFPAEQLEQVTALAAENWPAGQSPVAADKPAMAQKYPGTQPEHVIAAEAE